MNARTFFVAVVGILALCGPAWATDGMVSYWKFDDGSGTTAYDLFGDNHGTVYGAQWIDGQVEGALTFDGVNDYVDMSDMVKKYLDTNYTFSVWIKPKTILGIHGIAVYRRSTLDIGYQILLQLQHNNSDVQFIVGSLGNNAVASYPNVLTTNTWYHIAGVREGNVLNVYVNGVSGIPDSETVGTISPDNFKIGANHCCGHAMTSFFDGSIDEVAIYNRALSAEEIEQHYENGLAGYGYPVDVKIIATKKIERAIAEKLEALEKANAALEQEWTAYEVLDESLGSGIYGDLSKGDIVTAMQKIHSSIQHEEQSIDALEKSIEKLQDALAALGWEPPPEPQLVSHWKFDEGSGTTAYDSVGTNDGTVYGATWTTGQINGALNFDGADDYVEVIDSDDSLDIEESITIAAWVKLNDLSDVYFIVTKQPTGTSWTNYPGNYVFRTTPLDGYLQLYYQTGTGENEISKNTSTSGIGVGAWHHVSVTLVEGGNINFYIDSSSAGTVPQEGVFGLINDEPVRIGTRKDGWSYFNGLLDDVMIFDIALSAQEIQQLYNDGLAGL